MGIRQLRFSENQEADRAHFIRAYDQLRGAERQRRAAGMLP
jgi:hypothetical protein